MTSVVIGPRTLDQLRENMAAFDLDRPADLLERLDDASRPAEVDLTGNVSLNVSRAAVRPAA